MTAIPDATDASLPGRRSCRRWAVALLLLLAVSCAGGALAFFATNWLAPVAEAASLRQTLLDSVSESQTAWETLNDLWSRLEAGQAVDCRQETGTRPYFVAWRQRDLAAHPDLAALVDQLNGAIRNLHRAADAWTTACQRQEAVIHAESASAARDALDRADETLTALEAALSPQAR